MTGRSTSDGGSGRPNTVGMNRRQLDEFFNRRGSSAATGDQRRLFTRWDFRESRLPLHVSHPGGSQTTIRVACRDISCGGLSALHSAFVYPGSPCVVELSAPDGSVALVAGEVVRCVHVQGLVHELGIRFTHPIDARTYVGASLPDDAFAFERVDAESLTGRVVCAEDSKLDQKLIQHYLRGSQVRLVFASSAAAALDAVGSDCDLLICDQDLESGSGLEVIARVREQYPQMPVMMVTVTTDPEVRQRASELRVNAFLRKPVEAEQLLRAMSEFLLLRQMFRAQRSSSRTSRPTGTAARFLHEIGSAIPKLEEAIKQDDAMGAYAIALRIKTAAPEAGLDALGRAAAVAADAIGQSMSAKKSQAQIAGLIDVCRRAASAAA